MRKHVLLLVFIVLCKISNAQTDSLIYLRFPTVPPFSITTVVDSTKFSKDDLSKRKSTVIFIFSPDCEHCQQETKALTSNINLFKKAQIIMASPLEHQHLKKFYTEYKIADYPNIIMGRDPSYFFGTFYSIKTFPSIFVYDKKGRFVKAFEGGAPIALIADAL